MKKFKKIMYVVSDEPEDNSAFQRAISLASMNRASLTVVMPVPEPSPIQSEWAQDIASMELKIRLLEMYDNRLNAFIRNINTDKIDLKSKVLMGKPFIKIIREAIKYNYDLVITTPIRKYGHVERFLGSNIMHLLRKCPCPVWVMKTSEPESINKVLAAVKLHPKDSSPNRMAMSIMEIAFSLAEMEDAELHIFSAWHLAAEQVLESAESGLSRKIVNRLREQAKDEYRKQLDMLMKRFPFREIEHKVHFMKAFVGNLLPEVAEENDIDVIVMGTVGRYGLSGILIGNAAEEILLQVKCSVFAIKPEGFQSPVGTED